MGVLVVAVYTDIDQDITEYSQYEKAQECIAGFHGAHGSRLLMKGGADPGQALRKSGQPGAREVAKPHDDHTQGIRKVPVEYVTYLTCEKIKPKVHTVKRPTVKDGSKHLLSRDRNTVPPIEIDIPARMPKEMFLNNYNSSNLLNELF